MLNILGWSEKMAYAFNCFAFSNCFLVLMVYKDNFMFLDPPYDNKFTDYGYCKFGKEEHKKLATTTKKTIKKRLNDRTSDSWKSLRDLKKLKLQIKDKINKLKH